MGRKKLFASGVFLALCATAAYLLLHDRAKLQNVEENIADRLGFLEEPYC